MEATKCRYCGETLQKLGLSRLEQTLKRAIAYAGLATAFLSLFYALREGYYFIQARQAQRDAIESYKTAAAGFEALDNLDDAVLTLEQAVAIRPTDIILQRRLFLLRAHNELREVEDWGVQADNPKRREAITALSIQGFRLLYFPSSKSERANVLVMLGRLASHDRKENDEARITALFEEAYGLAPHDADVLFRYGHWLLARQPEKGFDLIGKAIDMQPENALYRKEMGEHKLEHKAYRDALLPLRTAARLLPKQHELRVSERRIRQSG